MFKREECLFDSDGTPCSAWLYQPATGTGAPVIVVAHGLGGVREMRLDAYAERFAAAGYACFVFDYRNFGASGGRQRQRIHAQEQLADWNNAIDFVKHDKRIDGRRILLFGTSFSGGHVITLSARRRDILATVTQCPYTDNFAAIRNVPPATLLKTLPFLFADLLACLTKRPPVMIKLGGPPGSAAVMAVPDLDEFLRLLPENVPFTNQTPARTLLEFLKYSPDRFAGNIPTPILYAICTQDMLTPAGAALRCAAQSPRATVKTYPCGHFGIYSGIFFETAVRDYIAFFNRTLSATETRPGTEAV
ncbi:alpha/beta fold hydrolase [Neisseria leonii]|uniref:alpha/beta hydrolase n=1 Tax=Neisseria leonii TaxID=2995413 RepID=UPI0030CD2B79